MSLGQIAERRGVSPLRIANPTSGHRRSHRLLNGRGDVEEMLGVDEVTVVVVADLDVAIHRQSYGDVTEGVLSVSSHAKRRGI
jgi:hypothetical protein